MMKPDSTEVSVYKKVSTYNVRAMVASMLVVAVMTMAMVSGCAAESSSVSNDEAVPEVATPLDPIAGSEPMQSFGGEADEEGVE